MSITGYSATTPEDVLVDAGVLYLGSTMLGVSRGGFRFDPGKTYRQMEFDGLRTPMAENDRIVSYLSVISGKMLEFSDAQWETYEPGGTETSGPPILMTPKPVGSFLAAGDYLSNLALYLERGESGYLKILFAKALCKKYTLVTADNNEVEIDVEFEARAVIGSAGVAPYKLSMESALPS